MMDATFVYVQCEILASAFSGERIVEVVTAKGERFIAVVPVHYCKRRDGQPVGENEPSAEQPIDGWVDARVIRNGGGTARVSFPDGDDAEVNVELLKPQRAEERHVPV